MDAVRSAILRGVQERHGTCAVQMESLDFCMKISVEKHPDYIMYVRPNDRQTHFLCHYAHRLDMERPMCGVCDWRAECLKLISSTPMIEYDDQPFIPKRKRKPVTDPRCSCEVELHSWRQRRAFQMMRFVVSR
jgi:hypothetical protein